VLDDDTRGSGLTVRVKMMTWMNKMRVSAFIEKVKGMMRVNSASEGLDSL
jgi:hypothetical protein